MKIARHERVLVGYAQLDACPIERFWDDLALATVIARPLYALSSLTMRTALILIAFSGVLFLFLPFLMDRLVEGPALQAASGSPRASSFLLLIVSIIIYGVLSACSAILVFLLPLSGLHRRLVGEKRRLQIDADRKMEAVIGWLHQRIETEDLRDADPIHKTISSLTMKREVLAKVPTWPWEPGTLNVLLTALFLPVALWLVQRVLERIFNPSAATEVRTSCREPRCACPQQPPETSSFGVP